VPRSTLARRLGALLIALATGAIPALAARAGAIIEYPIPTAASSPRGVTAGADGALWFTESAADRIGRITTSGMATEFPLPGAGGRGPYGVAPGPDGALWFAEDSGNQIGRITPAGAVSEFPVPTAGSHPRGITSGPDGNLWFTEVAADQIGRITPAGVVTEFPIPGAFPGPNAITAGPDGALWFTAANSGMIGRISVAGAVTLFPLPTPASGPFDITAGPDGALWFTESGASQIGRITTSGAATEFPLPTAAANPWAIAAGPDGALWFTELAADQIGRITTAGAVTEYPIPTAGSLPSGISAGPDGALWFTERGANQIGRFGAPAATATPAASATLSPTPPPSATLSPTPPPSATSAPSATPAPSATGAPSASATPCAAAFSDVGPADYFYTPVLALACRGVVAGYADGSFRPYNVTTRAQMVKLVMLGFAHPPRTPGAGAATFADVPPGQPFFAYIETAAADGVVSGYGCGGPGEPCDSQNRPYFRPSAYVTRGQLAKIDATAAGWPLRAPAAATFADVAPGTAFYASVETAACHGVIAGYTCGGPGEPCDAARRPYFRPGANATRGQIAKIVYLSTGGAGGCAAR
jgi:virginiamycin B lyase